MTVFVAVWVFFLFLFFVCLFVLFCFVVVGFFFFLSNHRGNHVLSSWMVHVVCVSVAGIRPSRK